MKLTSTQLRQIIKEEISRVSRNYPVRDKESVLAAFEALKNRETNLKSGVLLDDLAFSLSTNSQNLIRSKAFKESGLVVNKESGLVAKVEQSKISANESTAYRKGMLLEGHNRITPEEMNAWMRGDWGFVSESHEEKLYDSDADWVNAIYDDNRTIDELLTAYHEMSDKGTTFGHEGDILNDYLNVGVNDVNDPSLPAELKVRVVQLIIELQDLAGIEKEQDVEQEKPEDIKTILRKKGISAY